MSTRSPSGSLLVPRDLVGPFAASRHFARAGVAVPSTSGLKQNWEQITNAKAMRDFTALDESGDFTPLSKDDLHPFLVGAAVGFDAGSYRRIAKLLYPWRHHVFDDDEVKASAPHRRLTEDEEDDLWDELARTTGLGHCAITIGVIDKVSHHGGELLRPGFDKVAVRQRFHMDLLRVHHALFRPRTKHVRFYIDDCGLTGPQQKNYAVGVRDLLDDLGLNVKSDVQFADSLLVETIQLADLVAGTVRRRFDDPALTDPEAFEAAFAPLARRFLLADLTVRD